MVKIYSEDFIRENQEIAEDIQFYQRESYDHEMQDSFGRKVRFVYEQPYPNPLANPYGSTFEEQSINLPHLPYKITSEHLQRWQSVQRKKKELEEISNQKLLEVVDSIELLNNREKEEEKDQVIQEDLTDLEILNEINEDYFNGINHMQAKRLKFIPKTK